MQRYNTPDLFFRFDLISVALLDMALLWRCWDGTDGFMDLLRRKWE